MNPDSDHRTFLTERHASVSRHPTLCGINLIEVHPADQGWQLIVRFIPVARGVFGKAAIPAGIDHACIHITGLAEELPALQVVRVNFPLDDPAALAIDVQVCAGHDAGGRAGPYRLVIDTPNMDPVCARAIFTLGSTTNCRSDPALPMSTQAQTQAGVDIDYLAKDYASFRRLMFDHIALHAPQWQERHPADLGVALVEALAYAGDYLSYYQDAVATEAYLGTARRRESIRRHARLLDYPLHEGCNARVWVRVQVDADDVPLPKGAVFLTREQAYDTCIPTNTYKERIALVDRTSRIFESMHGAMLSQQHNEMPLYSWGARECVLAAGTISATLKGEFPRLAPGDVLLIEEGLDVSRGNSADEIPGLRHIVRLTDVHIGKDELHGRPVTQVRWAADDALPRAVIAAIARGNIVLADHGKTVHSLLPVVASAELYRPSLNQVGITFRSRYEHRIAIFQSATNALRCDPRDALPAVRLMEIAADGTITDTVSGVDNRWSASADLLSANPFSQNFVVETGNDGATHLRFGDGCTGKRPSPRTRFKATYRVGGGPDGNVGAGTITHIVSDDGRITGVDNPISAVGGTAPEDIGSVRLHAPETIKQQFRCITVDDYASATERYPGIKQAQARLHWTGSWRTVFIHVQRSDNRDLDDDFRRELEVHLAPLRAAGHDLEILPPRFVPVLLDLTVQQAQGCSPAPVRRALLQELANGSLAEGRTGLFQAGSLGFGQSIYRSHIVERAQQITGVAWIEVTRLQRADRPDDHPIAEQLLAGPEEILRLDINSNKQQFGALRLAFSQP